MKFNKSKKIEIFVHQHLPPSYVIPYLQPLSKSKTDTFKKHLFAKALPMHFSASVPRSIYRVNGTKKKKRKRAFLSASLN
jgi:hypothetical protein